ncbi:hypothetical protein GCM10022248_82520 [Nonomuraea soli]
MHLCPETTGDAVVIPETVPALALVAPKPIRPPASAVARAAPVSVVLSLDIAIPLTVVLIS